MMHSRHDGPGAGKAYGSQSAYQSKHVQQQYGEPVAPKEKHYFYESPSKYISLKKFSEELFQFSDMRSEKDTLQSKTKSVATTG